jgi:hypothetical protein
MKTSTIVMVVVLAAIVLVGILVFSGPKGNTNAPANTQQNSSQSSTNTTPQVTQQTPTTVVSAFPAGFPVEAAAQNTASYKYVPAASSQQQSTLEYISQKTVAQNQKTFLDYLNANGFKIGNKVEKSDMVFYYATKDNNDLSITITKSGSDVKVSASYLKK